MGLLGSSALSFGIRVALAAAVCASPGVVTVHQTPMPQSCNHEITCRAGQPNVNETTAGRSRAYRYPAFTKAAVVAGCTAIEHGNRLTRGTSLAVCARGGVGAFNGVPLTAVAACETSER